ncbi:hypothetical protein MMC24_002226 [Lignoscripta atroalba]|nr:hypothetical protein [Lignoscripta atroalba]
MICHRCLHRLHLSRAASTSSSSSRLFSTLPSLRYPPAATSKSLTQLISTPFTPASTPEDDAQTSKSSVPAGTPLKGLGFLKGKDPPVAGEDAAYPAWLWGLLEEGGERGKKKRDGDDEEGDMFSKSKKTRRIAVRQARRAANSGTEALAPKVPLEHQSIDLPAGDGSVQGALKAGRAREEVRDAMRKGRRKGIKEANFLKAMG